MLSLKASTQKALKHVHLYERAKASHLYDLYWRIADKEVINSRDREVKFYRDLLKGFRPGDLIFDIGANQGFKTEIFLRLGARVVAVDPDEANQSILKERFLTYRLIKKPVVIVGKAVSDKNGPETYWIDEPGSAKNTLSEKWVKTLRTNESKFGERLDFEKSVTVETITLENLITKYGAPFFIKIDVEGHEANVLQGLRHPIPYVSFEVNLPEFEEEGLHCVELLEQLAPDGLFNYTVDSQTKLGAQSWVNAGLLRQSLAACPHDSIEVFWKTLG